MSNKFIRICVKVNSFRLFFLFFSFLFQCNAQICYTPAGSYSFSSGSGTGVPNDFNGDGKIDLLILNGPLGNASIYLGQGNGNFTLGNSFNIGPSPQKVVSADFNGDGNADIATANAGSLNNDNLTVLLGTGTGSIQAINYYPAGQDLFSLATADFNSDGKMDLVTVTNTQEVSILIANTLGYFNTPIKYPTGSSPVQVLCSDFNNDGKQDIAVLNDPGVGSYKLSILTGLGTGYFNPYVDVSFGGGNPSTFINGDFNLDGNMDLAVGMRNSFNAIVLMGAGLGSVFFPVYIQGGFNPIHIVAEDVNGDSYLDLLTANNDYPGNLTVILGTGTSSFSPKVDLTYDATVGYIACSDFNGDGRQDLCVPNYSLHSTQILLNCYGVGLQENSINDHFLIYPNPASSSFIIEALSIEAGYFEVYEISGRLIMHQNLTGKTNIEVGELINGLYLVVLFDGDKNKLGTKKIVVQH